MASVNISMKNNTNMENWDNIIFNRVKDALEVSGVYLVSEVKKKITKMKAIDTGFLRKSISCNFFATENIAYETIGSGVKYAVYVHEGTRPHWAPFEPLRKWVYRKNPKLRKNEGKIIGITKKMQKKIAEKGTKARPFLTEVRNEKENIIRDITKQIIMRAVKEINQ